MPLVSYPGGTGVPTGASTGLTTGVTTSGLVGRGAADTAAAPTSDPTATMRTATLRFSENMQCSLTTKPQDRLSGAAAISKDQNALREILLLNVHGVVLDFTEGH